MTKNLAEGSVIVKKESAVKTCEEGANKTVVFNSVTCDFVRETRLVLLPEAFPTCSCFNFFLPPLLILLVFTSRGQIQSLS